MDSLENKDSDDSIKLEMSPPESKDESEAENTTILSSDVSSVNQTGSTDDIKDDSIKEDPLKDFSGWETNPAEDTLDSSKEVVKETLAIKEEEPKKKRRESTNVDANVSKSINSGSPKMANTNKATVSPVSDMKDTKRKRRTPSDQQNDESFEMSVDEAETKVKRVKTKSTNDNYCWRCHKDSVDARCSACPRSWHRKCMGGAPPTSINENWICGECATILKAENAETRSEVVAHLSIDHLCMLLKYIVECMRSCAGSEPFLKAVDLNEVQNYMDYVVKPMDLNLLESNVRAKLYGSTDAFMADAKWIQHNCIVFNTCGGVYADTSKLTNAAKMIIKTAKQEVAEIEACPDCYVRGRNLPRPHPMWFIEACRKPHPLIWAKLKGFPFWPAKAMPRVNGQGYVDVRFFGQHDRAWVPPKDLYLYSRDPPAPMPRKRKAEMAECIKEITRHIRKLEMSFGPFRFAAAKTPYNPQDPMQIKILLPQYDPSRPNERASLSSGTTTRRKSPFRKRATPLKRKLETDSPSSLNEETVVESSTREAKTETPTKIEDDKARIDDSNSETGIVETTRPKKRAKKQATSSGSSTSETKNTSDNDKEPSSPIQVIETSSTSINDETTVKIETVSNGTPETSTPTGPLIKVTSPSKLKNEKIVIPLEKSLAALLRKVNPKGRLSNPRNIIAKSTVTHVTPNSPKIETKTNFIKVYKPKARMVDKVNAEKALKSTIDKEHEKPKEIAKTVEAKMINGVLTPVNVPTTSLANNSSSPGNVSLLNNKRDNNIIITNSLLKMPPKKIQPRILVLNNGTLEPKQNVTTSEEKPRNEAPIRVKQTESLVSPQILLSANQKKQSRAKKSFPNKTPRLPQLLPKLPKPSTNSLDTMVYIPAQRNENGTEYQLPPPVAGPVSAQLHRAANDIAKRIAQLMEESIKDAADSSHKETGTSMDTHQATIHSLRLQIERMRWQHQQQLAELKHNTDRTLREMRTSLEAERLRAVEEVRREAEEEKTRCIDETKSKQWCAQCGNEALFYCCWNTAYCDHLCQQAHWQSHQRKCAQKPSVGSTVSPVETSNNKQQQQNQQKKSIISKGNSGVETIEVSVARSAFLSPNVITKNLKIP